MSMPRGHRRSIVLIAMVVLPVVILLVLARAGAHPAAMSSALAEVSRIADIAAATIARP
jgi:hypothetical protein